MSAPPSGIDQLVSLIHSGDIRDWSDRNEKAFSALFGSPSGRYAANAMGALCLRAPVIEGGVTYAAYIHPRNPNKGTYGGFSFVMTPAAGKPCMIGLCVGTAGLSPDDAILGRPGHARKANAVAEWLNQAHGHGRRVAWAKSDPTRTDQAVPGEVIREHSSYDAALDRYKEVLYFLYFPTEDEAATREALCSLLDITLSEREFRPLATARPTADQIRGKWMPLLFSTLTAGQVEARLDERKYVVVQGPPGTGKTRMALELMKGRYGGRGRSIQFHPSTSYESFIGGLVPAPAAESLGFHFVPTPGALMQAATEAAQDPTTPYLLHIDEINRADLGKVLGEAIFLLEPRRTVEGENSKGPAEERQISLQFDFGPPFHRDFHLPENLHILGTMNSADRSIAMLDVAVRRRFAFLPLWPDRDVVEKYGCAFSLNAFDELLNLFVEFASDEALQLMPGHSYF